MIDTHNAPHQLLRSLDALLQGRGRIPRLPPLDDIITVLHIVTSMTRPPVFDFDASPLQLAATDSWSLQRFVRGGVTGQKLRTQSSANRLHFPCE